jgi:anti-sigma factor RsiW
MTQAANPSEFTCQELIELITEYLEHALPEPEVVRFEEHLTVCEGCRTYLHQIEETAQAVGGLAETTLSADAEATLLNAFRDWKSGR